MKILKKNTNNNEFECYIQTIIKFIDDNESYLNPESEEEIKILYPLLLEKLLQCKFKNKILKNLIGDKNIISDFKYYKFYFYKNQKQYKSRMGKIKAINFYIKITLSQVLLGFECNLINYKRYFFIDSSVNKDNLIKLINLKNSL